MKGLLRNQGFPLHKCFSGHLKRLPLRTFWMQRGQKNWFLTAPCYVWLAILLAFVLLPTLTMAAPALAPSTPQSWGERGAATRQGPTVRIDPAQSVVGAGQTFDISVMIEEADDLGGFEFTMLFVTTTVTVDSVTVGDFPGSTGRTVIPAVGPTIDNQAGTASLGVVTVGSASGPSGTGVLVTVTLTAQSFGESSLDLQDVVVVDTSAERKTPTVEDGVVRVGFTVYLPLILKDW
jgi:hypothetical protein